MAVEIHRQPVNPANWKTIPDKRVPINLPAALAM
jgi:hypothetical protein